LGLINKEVLQELEPLEEIGQGKIQKTEFQIQTL
jgi:hypothetical protein